MCRFFNTCSRKANNGTSTTRIIWFVNMAIPVISQCHYIIVIVAAVTVRKHNETNLVNFFVNVGQDCLICVFVFLRTTLYRAPRDFQPPGFQWLPAPTDGAQNNLHGVWVTAYACIVIAKCVKPLNVYSRRWHSVPSSTLVLEWRWRQFFLFSKR